MTNRKPLPLNILFKRDSHRAGADVNRHCLGVDGPVSDPLHIDDDGSWVRFDRATDAAAGTERHERQPFITGEVDERLYLFGVAWPGHRCGRVQHRAPRANIQEPSGPQIATVHRTIGRRVTGFELRNS